MPAKNIVNLIETGLLLCRYVTCRFSSTAFKGRSDSCAVSSPATPRTGYVARWASTFNFKMGSERDGKSICLFDMDGTLTAPRQYITPHFDSFLQQLRKNCHIGVVGGSNVEKITEQLGKSQEEVFQKYDYIFAENGLVAYKGNVLFSKSSIQKELGEEKLQRFMNTVLRALSEVELPFKRGTFIEFRSGMINVSPVGRNCTQDERDQFEKFDKIHKVRQQLVTKLEKEFSGYNLKFSIGGQVSFDVFPNGWDKTFCLRHLEADGFTNIYFFGDKTFPGGNDHEIYEHPKTIGHSVTCPADTQAALEKLFECDKISPDS